MAFHHSPVAFTNIEGTRILTNKKAINCARYVGKILRAAGIKVKGSGIAKTPKQIVTGKAWYSR